MDRASIGMCHRTCAARRALHLATLGATLAVPARAHAQQLIDDPETGRTVRASTDPSRFLPGVIAAQTGAGLVAGTGWAGYDGATRAPLSGGFAEARLAPWLVVGVGVIYAPGNDLQPGAVRPSVVARVRLLEQQLHGVDAGVAVAYREDRFVGEDGFLQGAITVGRHGDAGTVLANLAFGGDGEGDDREGELRLVGLARLGPRIHLGLDGRLRRSLGSTDPRRAAHGTPSLELMAGPAATCAVGPIALIAEAGVSAVQLARFQTGLLALGGVGAVF